MTGRISGGRSASGQGWRAGERKQAPSFSPGIEQQDLRGKNRSLPLLSKERCRNLNWKQLETTVLITCMKEGGRFRKGKITDWEATREEIENISGSTRTKKECQRRSDTLTKAQKQVKRCWGVNYKQFFESTEKERSGKLSTRLTQVWYEDLQQIEQQQQKPGHLSSSNSGRSPSLSGTQTPSRSDLAEDAGSSGTDLITSLQSSPAPDRAQFQDPAVPHQTHNSESTDLVFQQWAQGPATPNRTGIAQISCNTPSPVSTEFQDPAVPYQTHSSESTDLVFQQRAQGPATPNRTGVVQSLCDTPSPVSTQFQDPAVPNQTHSSESTDLVFQQQAQGPASPNHTGVPQVVQAVDPKLQDGEDSGAVCLHHAPCDPWTLESIDKSLQESQDCYYFRTYFCTYGWIPTWELNNVESQSSSI